MPVVNKSGCTLKFTSSMIRKCIKPFLFQIILKESFEKMMADRIPSLEGKSGLVFDNIGEYNASNK